MKTKLTLLALILALATLPSCHKEKPMQKELQLSELTITSYSTVAIISITVTYPGKLTATLYVSPNQDMSSPITFTAEKTDTTEEPYNFTITATDLQKSTDYWCQVEIGNDYISEKTPITKFSTLYLPEGAIDGLFSINYNGDQVHFSQGNLQYKASTNTWQFAANQWDFIGSDNSNISSTYSGWIDLFGWGTSGYNHGAVCYQPWSTSTNYPNYYAYGSSNYNLYDQNGQADWGVYNPISNGGNQANQWRTLTGGNNGEWKYIFDTRSTPSGIRYAKATVNGVNGVILVPDNWNTGTYTLNSTNTSGASFSSNTISQSVWTYTLEPVGCVFLPAASYRYGTSVNLVGSYGLYWSSSYSSGGYAFDMSFDDNSLNATHLSDRIYGFSVRLARVVR